MTLSRRHALRILGASLAMSFGAWSLRGIRGLPRPVSWQGAALGALSSMTLWSANPGHAAGTIRRMQSEIARLEDIFSLYRPQSALSRLNRAGTLDSPPEDLLRVLDESRRIAQVSGGAFDPTVQPLWRVHARALLPERRQIDAARALVDYTALSTGRRQIRFARPGMAISLNGIAQGYITDRVTDLLRNEGYENAVIALGETRALGDAPDGEGFAIDLVNPSSPDRVKDKVRLSGAALSVSAGYGNVLPDGAGTHIFDPRTGQSAARLAQVAVIAPQAVQADALSTAIYVAGEAEARAILSSVPSARAILTRRDGTSLTFYSGSGKT